MNARREAERLRQRCRQSGAVDVYGVAAMLGLRVDEWPLPADELHEVFIKNSIAVSTDVGEEEKRWAIAHGIGHYILHSNGNQIWFRAHTTLSDKLEAQAEEFTFRLLVNIEEAWRERLDDVREIAAYFVVPVEPADVPRVTPNRPVPG